MFFFPPCKLSSRSSAKPDLLDTSVAEDIDAFLEDLLEDNDGGDHLQPKVNTEDQHRADFPSFWCQKR